MFKLLILILISLFNPNILSQNSNLTHQLPEERQWNLVYFDKNSKPMTELPTYFHIFNDSALNKKTVYASIGIGIVVLGGLYTTSLNIIPEFHPRFKLSVGFNIFFTTSSNNSTMFGLNLTPYYVIKLNKNSNIDIGPGITYLNRKIIFTPSFKFDTFIQENVKLGIELKYPVLSGSDIIFLPFLILNLSFRI